MESEKRKLIERKRQTYRREHLKKGAECSKLNKGERRKPEFDFFWARYILIIAGSSIHSGRFCVYVWEFVLSDISHAQMYVPKEREFWSLKWVQCLHVIMSFSTNLKFFVAMVSFSRFRSISSIHFPLRFVFELFHSCGCRAL